MPNYSKNDIILVQYPFSDLSSSKVRPNERIFAIIFFTAKFQSYRSAEVGII